MLNIKQVGKQGFSTISHSGCAMIEPRGPNPTMPYELGDSIAIPFSHYNRDGTLALDTDFSRCVLGVYVEPFSHYNRDGILVQIHGTVREYRTNMLVVLDKEAVINMTAYERFDKASKQFAQTE